MYWLELAGEADIFAALEATAVSSGLQVRAPGIATARAIDTTGVANAAFTRAAGRLLGWSDADPDSASALLRSADLNISSGTVAVRARDVRATAGVDTQAIERALGAVLVDRGFTIDLEDPDHELRALCAAGDLGRDPAADPTDPLDPVAAGAVDTDPTESFCALGWTSVRGERSFAQRAPTERPFFQPGSMDPLLARACVILAGARPGRRLLDPMCGTGGTLIEAGLIGASVLGVDADRRMVTGTRENLTDAVDDWQGELVCGDAARLPLAADSVDGFVVDVPYGRQSAIAATDATSLVASALTELRRVAPRGVLIADRSWAEAARDAGWSVSVVARRRVHGSLVRYLHLLV